ncbi:MAG: hypothetical protein V1794_07825, partial [Candidatus Glassbacteria bacterium]
MLKTGYLLLTLISAALASCLWQSCAGRSFTVLADGRSDCVIVTGCGRFADVREAADAQDQVRWHDPQDSEAAAACTEAFAAVELRTYLCRIGGLNEADSTVLPKVDSRAELPPGVNLIVVGRAASTGKYAALDRELSGESADSYLIRSGNIEGRNVLVLRGRTRAGTLYAVYDLLARLGCRWYAPGANGEIVPRRERIALERLDIQESPAVDIRGFWVSNGKVEAGRMTWEGSLTDRGNPGFFLWMARNRLNFFWSTEKDWKLMKKF